MKIATRWSKTVCVLLVSVTILLSMSACGGAQKALSPISLNPINGNIMVGQTYQMQVFTEGSKAVDASRVLWESSDTAVATVSPDGVVTVRKKGACQITAKDKNDLSNQAGVTLFCPYETAPVVDTIKTKADSEQYSSGGAELIMDSLVDAGKTVVKTMTGKVGGLGIALTMLSFFEKDKYVITLAECRHTVKDGIIYTVCDWNNSNMYIPNAPDRITAEAVFQSLDGVVNTSHYYGNTFEGLAARIQAETVSQWPQSYNYRFDLMDDRYEYRVVVRADYTTFRTTDHYSNGAIIGLGYTIQDILSWDVAHLADNYMYKVITYDVIDVENVRLCIEYREKQ